MDFRISSERSFGRLHTPAASPLCWSPGVGNQANRTSFPWVNTKGHTVWWSSSVWSLPCTGGKRSQTQYRCKRCKVSLHLEPCFETYYTKFHYNKNTVHTTQKPSQRWKHNSLQRKIVVDSIHAKKTSQVGYENLGPGRFIKWLHVCGKLGIIHRLAGKGGWCRAGPSSGDVIDKTLTE